MKNINPEDVIVEIRRVGQQAQSGEPEKTEVDEMQSFVGRISNQRWLWHAINHYTGEVLAFVLGTREDEAFLQLKKLLEPFKITKFYTDVLKTYQRHISPQKHQISKFEMQRIERNHLTLRTRIKRLQRKTICYSRSVFMHDIVIGLFITKYEFGVEI